MGSAKLYKESGGFERQTFKEVAITKGGIKVLKNLENNNAKLPTYSNSPGTAYAVMRTEDGRPKQIMVYGSDRKQLKRIDLDHDHNGKEGFHVQFFNGEEPRFTLSSKERQMVEDLFEYYRRNV